MYPILFRNADPEKSILWPIDWTEQDLSILAQYSYLNRIKILY